MPCLLGCLALITPRLVFLLILLFSNYLETAYQGFLWPLLGFLFMPVTALAYAWAFHASEGHINGWPLVVVVLAVLFDLGLLGSSASSRRRRRF